MRSINKVKVNRNKRQRQSGVAVDWKMGLKVCSVKRDLEILAITIASLFSLPLAGMGVVCI